MEFNGYPPLVDGLTDRGPMLQCGAMTRDETTKIAQLIEQHAQEAACPQHVPTMRSACKWAANRPCQCRIQIEAQLADI